MEDKTILKPAVLFPRLKEFEHKAVFDSCDYVWQAVLRIHIYLESFFEKLGLKFDFEKLAMKFNQKIKPEKSVFLHEFSPEEFTAVPSEILAVYLEKFFPKLSASQFDLEQGSIKIGHGTRIEPYSFIIGPAIVGRRCEIRHNAYLRGDVVVGENCVIGHGSEIKNSILMNNSNIPHFNYVGDSVIGSNVNLGYFTGLLNFRADKSLVVIKVVDKFRNLLLKEFIPLKKFGSAVGDGCSIGANISFNPGFILMPDSQIIAVRNLSKELIWLGSLSEKDKKR